MKVADVENMRTLHIDASNKKTPQSVFIRCGAFCMEVDRGVFVAAISAAFDMLSIELVTKELAV